MKASTEIGAVVLTALALCFSLDVIAKGKGGSSSSGRSSSSHHASTRSPSTTSSTKSAAPKSSAPAKSTSSGHSYSHKAQGVARDSKGHIARDPKQRQAFEKSHPCPSTGKTSGACPGYVVDHIRPLKRGGADRPENMQWQTKAAAKQKDKTE